MLEFFLLLPHLLLFELLLLNVCWMLCSWSSRLLELNAHLQPPFRYAHSHTHTRLQTWRCFVSCNLTAFGQNNKPGQQRSPTEHNKLSIPGATDTKSQARQCATAHYKREASDRGLLYHTPIVQRRRGGRCECLLHIFATQNKPQQQQILSVSFGLSLKRITHTHSRLGRQYKYICMYECRSMNMSVCVSTSYCAIIKWNLFLNNYLWQGFYASGSLWATRKASTRLPSPMVKHPLKGVREVGGY